MITFTQMKKQAQDNCGLYAEAPEMAKITSDINTGVKLFQNAARRYWTRREKKTTVIAGQQYYQFPSDMLRVKAVKVLNGTRFFPLVEVHSEEEWSRLNVMPFFAAAVPTHFFIKGADEIGLYPVPKSTIASGLIVSYEPRMVDMAVADVTTTAQVTENSVNIVGTGDKFTRNMLNDCYLTTTDGSDGNWYKIVDYIDANHITIDNNYQGLTKSDAAILIGQCPSFPEEYHQAPIYYACQQFFLMRKDLESASMYKQLFNDLFNQYRQVYGLKTTGGVINPSSRASRSATLDPFRGLEMR